MNINFEELYNRHSDVINPDSIFIKDVNHFANLSQMREKYYPFESLQDKLIQGYPKLLIVNDFLNWMQFVWNFYVTIFKRKPNRLILPVNCLSLIVKNIEDTDYQILDDYLTRVFDRIVIEEYSSIRSIGFLYHDSSIEVLRQDRINKAYSLKRMKKELSYASMKELISLNIAKGIQEIVTNRPLDLYSVIEGGNKKSEIKQLFDSMKNDCSYQFNKIDPDRLLVIIGCF